MHEPRVGYYAHHQGHGHLHRATAVSQAVRGGLDGLSTHARPDGWAGAWTTLDDDAGAPDDPVTRARGRLHWVPLGHPGHTARMRRIARWVDEAEPAALVVDVSVEVALLARLLAVPVVSVALPGVRSDRVHDLGYAVSDLVVGPWPEAAADLVDTGLGPAPVPVGAISRFAPVAAPAVVDDRTVLVLGGSGGSDLGTLADQAARATPGWSWTALTPARWSADPWPSLQTAGVVVSHCGQNAVAEIAAARRPAVLVPQERPFDEQRQMARVLRTLEMPALVLDAWPEPQDWDGVLKEAAELDATRWATWNDGRGAERFAALLARYTR